ncbi:MAG: MBL fold metallo-hydrolase [Proteobacteria bacterium]|nr:MBL fold metallo-hydrolase [Pseudomonadota bacterium]
MKLTFLGATREVTGSCTLVTANGYRLLVDCGLFQGSREYESQNAAAFDFDPTEIDAVVLTHAHIDHSGRIPLLVKRGFSGPVYTHEATKDLAEVMLADAGFLAERQAAWENRKRDRNKQGRGHQAEDLIEPLFDRQDAADAHRQFEGMAYDQPVEVLPGFVVTFRDAGHILGSAIVELVVTEGERHKKVVFSGDLGHRGAPILREPSVVRQADLIVLESTYGDRCHRTWEDTWEEMGEILASSEAQKGNILIPAFTVGRTQELLMMFNEHFDDWGLGSWEVFLDSPMAAKATKIYEKHWQLQDKETRALGRSGPVFDLPNLHVSESVEDSIGINRIRSGAIIIAGSGMCTGGRIRHHLRHNIQRAGNKILIVGFQARGTTGRMLVDGAERIRIFGEEHTVKATVHTVGGLSAHADQQGLLDWYGNFDGHPAVKLIHGEEDAMAVLRSILKQRYSCDVSIADREESLTL